jgi:hypothetical protein
VERLTNKVQELEISSGQLRQYNESLENILSLLSQLQSCSSPDDFKKILVDEISARFGFDRCAFMDIDAENLLLEIKYAHGIEKGKWEKYRYPANSPL